MLAHTHTGAHAHTRMRDLSLESSLTGGVCPRSNGFMIADIIQSFLSCTVDTQTLTSHPFYSHNSARTILKSLVEVR